MNRSLCEPAGRAASAVRVSPTTTDAGCEVRSLVDVILGVTQAGSSSPTTGRMEGLGG